MTKSKGIKKILDNKSFRSALFTVAVIALCIAYYFLYPFFNAEKPSSNATFPITIEGVAKNDLEVHFIDVGQGDGILIKTPSGETILIDAGLQEEYAEKDLINYLKNNDVKRIDYAIMTHPDADHIGGFAKVFKKYKVKFVFRPYVQSDNTLTDSLKSRFNAETSVRCYTDVYANLLLDLKSERSDWVYINKDVDLIFDYSDDCQLKIDFLTPVSDLTELSYTDLNDYSPIIKVSYMGKSFLLTGDASINVEEEALAEYSTSILNADVLKVAHHGSDTSSSYSFVKAVSPDYAVISCGENNSYNHPKNSVIITLLSVNAKICRTDKQGSILFKVTKDGDLSVGYEKVYTGSLAVGY